jgi:hypothetical protein
MIDPERLAELEQAERDARYRAYTSGTIDDRTRARDIELESYRTGLGDDADD